MGLGRRRTESSQSGLAIKNTVEKVGDERMVKHSTSATTGNYSTWSQIAGLKNS